MSKEEIAQLTLQAVAASGSRPEVKIVAYFVSVDLGYRRLKQFYILGYRQSRLETSEGNRFDQRGARTDFDRRYGRIRGFSR